MTAVSLQYIFQRLHLFKQLGRHRLSAGFIRIVHFMPKCRLFYIKGYNNSLGFCQVEQIEKCSQKSMNGIRKMSVPCGKNLYPVKCTINYTVSVYDKQIHIDNSLRLHFCFTRYITIF